MKRGLLLLLVVQLLLGLAHAYMIPLWLPSDERGHWHYITDLAREHSIHVMSVGDPNYEAHQPPIYYAFGLIFYALTIGMGLDLSAHILRVATLISFLATTVIAK